MPTTKVQRKGREEKHRRGKLSEKAMSFHGRSSETTAEMLLRPRTVPNLVSGRSFAGVSPEQRPKLTKLLLNVTIQRSLGAIQVLMSPESTVNDLIAAALRQYAKEGRRTILPSTEPSGFDLHYSQFSLESLDRKEKLKTLGSRNFFLFPKKVVSDNGGGVEAPVAVSSCSKEAETVTKTGIPWLKFMDFLL